MPKWIDVTKLGEAVKGSTSWAQVCRAMNVKPSTGGQCHIKSRAVKSGLDFSHFIGRGWSKGKPAINRRPTAEFLVKDGPFINSDTLKKRLFRDGLKKKECEDCHATIWLEEECPLELDHVDSDRRNNELTNLRIRCPNCHAVKTRHDIKVKASTRG